MRMRTKKMKIDCKNAAIVAGFLKKFHLKMLVCIFIAWNVSTANTQIIKRKPSSA
jgi:hypothetical protein